jgi:hypothetical protein
MARALSHAEKCDDCFEWTGKAARGLEPHQEEEISRMAAQIAPVVFSRMNKMKK